MGCLRIPHRHLINTFIKSHITHWWCDILISVIMCDRIYVFWLLSLHIFPKIPTVRYSQNKNILPETMFCLLRCVATVCDTAVYYEAIKWLHSFIHSYITMTNTAPLMEITCYCKQLRTTIRRWTLLQYHSYMYVASYRLNRSCQIKMSK